MPQPEPPIPDPPILDEWPADAPSIQPLAFDSLPFSDNVSAAAVSPDGKTVYVAVDVEGLNIGAVLDDTFHVWCPIVGLLLAVVGLVAWIRAVRRPERRGEPHCRKCWYNLTGSQAAACPECGINLARRKPRIGRSKLRRLWLPVTLCAIGVIGGTLAGLVAPRGLRGFFASRGWYSARLGEWTRAVWDKSHPGGANRITWIQEHSILYALDVSSGRTKQLGTMTATLLFSLDITFEGLVVVSDTSRGGLALVAIDPQAQTTVGTVSIPLGSVFPSDHALIGGETPEGEVLVAATNIRSTAANPKTTLLAWNPRTNSSREVLATSAGTSAAPTKANASQPALAMSVPRGIVLVPGNVGARYVSFPESIEAYPAKTTILHWFDDSGAEIAISQLKNVSPFAAPLFSTDGSTLYFPGDHAASSVREWSVAELLQGNTTPRRVLDLGMYPAADRGFQLSADGRVMLVGRFYDQLVRDTRADRWHARLENDTGTYGLRARISRNGETVAAVAQTRASTHILLVWRVPRPAP